MNYTVLVVDPDMITSSIVNEVLSLEYSVLFNSDASLIEYNDTVACILIHVKADDLEWNTSAMDRIKSTFHENVPVVGYADMYTDYTDKLLRESLLATVVYMPFNSRVLASIVCTMIELYMYRKFLEDELVARTAKLTETQEMLASNTEFVLNALGAVVEYRDLESGDHVKRVSELTRVILDDLMLHDKSLCLSYESIELISKAAAIHDIGKIAIPDSILNKPGRLTPSEYDIMKTHPVVGCEILSRFNQQTTDFYQYCYDICRWHHERFDGTGYPDGIAGSDIPIWAQVVALADVLDALTSKRVYKEAYNIVQSFNMIKSGQCGKFSPDLIQSMDRCRSQLSKIITSLGCR